ncbi:unnamed protein product [Tenebrio molitor]|nr:unnamed protein product [Tenebrio molitor]
MTRNIFKFFSFQIFAQDPLREFLQHKNKNIHIT